MKILRVLVNGMETPLGFNFSKVKISWSVSDFTDKKQKNARIRIAKDEEMTEIVCMKEGAGLCQAGESIELICEPMTRYYVDVYVCGENGENAISSPTWFETAKMHEPWAADWITTNPEDQFHPVFVKSYCKHANSMIKKANLYICGLGLYEAYLNKEKIGNEFLAPYMNSYDDYLQYQTYDITNLIREGTNNFSVLLGNGWYKGKYSIHQENAYHDKFRLIAEAHIWYEDGSYDIVKTDDSWSYQGSDIESSGIYDGEVYDHTLWENSDNPLKNAVIDQNTGKELLTERESVPVTIHECLQPIEIIHTPKGEKVLDFGQNFAGFVEFIADFEKGTRIHLEFGEILQDGNFYNGNYRDATKGFVYVSAGSKEIVRSHFTFFGFRYVKVSGWIGELDNSVFSGMVIHSNLRRTGSIETSDPKINRLFLNALWGQKSNFIDIPTDCPQRSERLGWTGDIQAFTPTACYNMDTRQFFKKFMHDVRIEQNKNNGIVPQFVPLLGAPGAGTAVWGDLGTFTPRALYDFYGDRDMLEEMYGGMRAWVDWITEKDKKRGQQFLFNQGSQFGDWLSLDGITDQSKSGGTDPYFIASCYYYQSAKITAEAADILGYQEEADIYKALSEKIKEAILEEYYTRAGRLVCDTQTGYLVALKFGIYVDREIIIDGLYRRFELDNYKIKGGFVGAPLLCQTLSDNGLTREAYDFLFYEGFPGWLREINLGATTIWERWNSLLDDGTISGTGMNSMNHYAFGNVVEFLYRDTVGIKTDQPGFRSVRFEPKIDYRLSWAKGRYESVFGTYVSEWEVLPDGQIHVHYEVPFSCAAKAILPGCDNREIDLEAGSFDLTYLPDTDVRKHITVDTRFSEIKEDARTMKIIMEQIPFVGGMIMTEEPEILVQSIKRLKGMEDYGVTQETINNILKTL